MAGGVKEVAKIAEEADRISRQASEDARTGDAAVGRTIDGMKSISDNMENTARVITGLGQALAGDRQDPGGDRRRSPTRPTCSP